nr:MAG TPA: hypothetical protein [Caudoviricetes sp.]
MEEEEKAVGDLVNSIKTLSRLAGFEIMNRIEFKSQKTGRRYR